MNLIRFTFEEAKLVSKIVSEEYEETKKQIRENREPAAERSRLLERGQLLWMIQNKFLDQGVMP